MKLEKLEGATLKAQEDLKAAEAKVADLQKRAREAKTKAQAAKQAYKNARKLAHAARKLFNQSEEQLQEQREAVAKTQKRLAKALKRLVAEEVTGLPVLVPGAVAAERPARTQTAGRRGKRMAARRSAAP